MSGSLSWRAQAAKQFAFRVGFRTRMRIVVNSGLPDDLLLVIFSHLSDQVLLLGCGLICRNWNRLCADEREWQKRFDQAFQPLEFQHPDLPVAAPFSTRRPSDVVGTWQQPSTWVSAVCPRSATVPRGSRTAGVWWRNRRRCRSRSGRSGRHRVFCACELLVQAAYAGHSRALAFVGYSAIDCFGEFRLQKPALAVKLLDFAGNRPRAADPVALIWLYNWKGWPEFEGVRVPEFHELRSVHVAVREASARAPSDALLRWAQAQTCFYGYGTPTNYPVALVLLSALADAGLARAQYTVGWCYALGHCGLQKDVEGGKRYYRRAAAQGYQDAGRDGGLRNALAMKERALEVSVQVS